MRTRALRDEAVQELSERFHKYIESVLPGVAVQEHVFCVKHMRACPVKPSQQERAGKIWVEVAGSPCVAFVQGAFGNQENFLHQSAKVFVAWVAKVRAFLPDVAIHECVPGFPNEILSRYLNAGFPANKPLYETASAAWDVLHEGIPVHRARRYTVCVLAKHGRPSLQLQEVWDGLVFRNRLLGCDVFLRAPAADLEALNQEMASKRQLPAKRINSKGQPCKWAWEVFMTAKQREVLSKAREAAKALELDWLRECPDGMPVSDAGQPYFQWLVNVAQGSTFQPSVRPMHTSYMNTLLRSSRLFADCFDRLRSRPVHPFEEFVIQGHPVYMPAGHRILQACNMEDVLRSALSKGLGLSDLYNMAGNGMHINAVGELLLFVLSLYQWQRPAAIQDG